MSPIRTRLAAATGCVSTIADGAGEVVGGTRRGRLPRRPEKRPDGYNAGRRASAEERPEAARGLRRNLEAEPALGAELGVVENEAQDH